MRIFVGLGNPGPRYTGTRHNAGFLVLEELAARAGARFQRAREADVARCRLPSGAPPQPLGASASAPLTGHAAPSEEVVLLKPRTFMNLSGRAVQATLARERARPETLLVVHDDLDLPLGRVRFKQGGGAGGQRGVQDIIDAIGPEFLRLKVGIGRPPEGWATEAWVLSRFRDDERALVEDVVRAAADAIETFVRHGIDAAMNQANGLRLGPDRP